MFKVLSTFTSYIFALLLRQGQMSHRRLQPSQGDRSIQIGREFVGNSFEAFVSRNRKPLKLLVSGTQNDSSLAVFNDGWSMLESLSSHIQEAGPFRFQVYNVKCVFGELLLVNGTGNLNYWSLYIEWKGDLESQRYLNKIYNSDTTYTIKTWFWIIWEILVE